MCCINVPIVAMIMNYVAFYAFACTIQPESDLETEAIHESALLMCQRFYYNISSGQDEAGVAQLHPSV